MSLTVVAAQFHGRASADRAASGKLRHFPEVRWIGDVYIAARVHREARGHAGPCAHHDGSLVVLEHQLRTLAGAVDISRRDDSAGIGQHHRSIARAGVFWRERHIHRAGVACAVGVAGPDGIAASGARIGKVQPFGALGQHGRGDARVGSGEGEGQGLLRRFSSSHGNSAEVHAVPLDLDHQVFFTLVEIGIPWA